MRAVVLAVCTLPWEFHFLTRLAQVELYYLALLCNLQIFLHVCPPLLRPGDQNCQVGSCRNGAGVGPTFVHRIALKNPPATATFCPAVAVLRPRRQRSPHAAECEPRIFGVPYAIQVKSVTSYASEYLTPLNMYHTKGSAPEKLWKSYNIVQATEVNLRLI